MTPPAVGSDPAVATLHHVWVQHCYRSTVPGAEVIRLRTPDAQPPRAPIISSPYDPEARDQTKRDTSWVGYTVHLTEPCDDEPPKLITQVTTTPAPTDDHVMLLPIQAALAARDRLPAEHDVDRGSVDAAALPESQRRHAVDVVGPLQGTATWQAHTPNARTNLQFAIDGAAAQVPCPAGNMREPWQEVRPKAGAAADEPTGSVVVFGRDA